MYKNLTESNNTYYPTAVGEFLSGIKEAMPIVLGYMPIGFAYGVMAISAGLNILETVMMSILVYAGSAQFIAVSLIASGTGPGAIIITTFLVNLRHLLMSAALLPYLKRLRIPTLAALSYEITDESFALATTLFKKRKATAPFMAGLQVTSHSTWVLSSLAGAVSGSLLPDVDRFGLDFALPAMFIILLVLQLHTRLHLAVSAIALFCSLLIAHLFPGNWNIITATVIAATLGVLIEGVISNEK